MVLLYKGGKGGRKGEKRGEGGKEGKGEGEAENEENNANFVSRCSLFCFLPTAAAYILCYSWLHSSPVAIVQSSDFSYDPRQFIFSL